MQAFDGEIHCESQLGKGTKFLFKWKVEELLIGSNFKQIQKYTNSPQFQSREIYNIGVIDKQEIEFTNKV